MAKSLLCMLEKQQLDVTCCLRYSKRSQNILKNLWNERFRVQHFLQVPLSDLELVLPHDISVNASSMSQTISSIKPSENRSISICSGCWWRISDGFIADKWGPFLNGWADWYFWIPGISHANRLAISN